MGNSSSVQFSGQTPVQQLSLPATPAVMRSSPPTTSSSSAVIMSPYSMASSPYDRFNEGGGDGQLTAAFFQGADFSPLQVSPLNPMFTTSNMDTHMKGHAYDGYSSKAAWVEAGNKENYNASENGPSLFDVTMSRVARARSPATSVTTPRSSRSRNGSQRNLHKRKKHHAPPPPILRRSSFSRSDTISTSGMLYPKKKKKQAPQPPTQHANIQARSSSKGRTEQVGVFDFADDEPVIAPPVEFSDNTLHSGSEQARPMMDTIPRSENGLNSSGLSGHSEPRDSPYATHNQSASNDTDNALQHSDIEPDYATFNGNPRTEESGLGESGVGASARQADSVNNTGFDTSNNNNSVPDNEETRQDHVYATVQKRTPEPPSSAYYSDDEDAMDGDIMSGEFPAAYVPSVVSVSESRKSLTRSFSNPVSESLQRSGTELVKTSSPPGSSLIKEHAGEDTEEPVFASPLPMLNYVPDTEDEQLKPTRIAPPPPVENTTPSAVFASIEDTAARPPVLSTTPSEVFAGTEDIGVPPPPPPPPPPPLFDSLTQQDGNLSSAPLPPPPPPPLPPITSALHHHPPLKHSPSVDSSQSRSSSPEPTPPVVPPKQYEQPRGRAMSKDLQDDIREAAEKRANRPLLIPEPQQFISSHQLFAAQLYRACQARESRKVHGTLRFRNTYRSTFYSAKTGGAAGSEEGEGESSETSKDKVEEMLDFAHNQHKTSQSNEPNRVSVITINDEEWTPEHDLDGLMDDNPEAEDEKILTARGANFYDAISSPGGAVKSSSDRSDTEKQYKKNRASKKSKRKGGSIHRIKKSLQEAIGSIGRSFSKGKKKFQELAKGEEGWEIFRTEKYDAPPDGPISIKAIEMHPVYAYNTDKDQLMLLPDYDRVIVTQDGRKILEADLLKIEKFKKTVSEIGGSKQRARLSNVFDLDDSHMTAWEKEVQEERRQQNLMEVQFAHIRQLSKKLSSDSNVHSSVRSIRGLQGYSDAERATESSTSGGQDYNAYSLDRALTSQKKRGRYRKSTAAGNKPRHKVLAKGMDAYSQQHHQAVNPVYASDELLPQSGATDDTGGSKMGTEGARVSVISIGETEDTLSASQGQRVQLNGNSQAESMVVSTDSPIHTTDAENMTSEQQNTSTESSLLESNDVSSTVGATSTTMGPASTMLPVSTMGPASTTMGPGSMGPVPVQQYNGTSTILGSTPIGPASTTVPTTSAATFEPTMGQERNNGTDTLMQTDNNSVPSTSTSSSSSIDGLRILVPGIPPIPQGAGYNGMMGGGEGVTFSELNHYQRAFSTPQIPALSLNQTASNSVPPGQLSPHTVLPAQANSTTTVKNSTPRPFQSSQAQLTKSLGEFPSVPTAMISPQPYRPSSARSGIRSVQAPQQTGPSSPRGPQSPVSSSSTGLLNGFGSPPHYERGGSVTESWPDLMLGERGLSVANGVNTSGPTDSANGSIANGPNANGPTINGPISGENGLIANGPGPNGSIATSLNTNGPTANGPNQVGVDSHSNGIQETGPNGPNHNGLGQTDPNSSGPNPAGTETGLSINGTNSNHTPENLNHMPGNMDRTSGSSNRMSGGSNRSVVYVDPDLDNGIIYEQSLHTDNPGSPDTNNNRPSEAIEANENCSPSAAAAGVIPTKIMQQYGHENLVAL